MTNSLLPVPATRFLLRIFTVEYEASPITLILVQR
jgi:hypothetical protein